MPKAFKALQETEEDLSVLPTLALEDIPPDIEIIRPDRISDSSPLPPATTRPPRISSISPAPVIPTGICRNRCIPLIPFFCMAFTGTGTAKRDYADLAALMDLYTGGISLSPYSGSGFNGDNRLITFLSLQGKALNHNIEPMFDIFAELVSEVSFKDLTRLKSLLFQYRAGLEASIVGNGHRYAMLPGFPQFLPGSRTGGDVAWGSPSFSSSKSLTEKIADAE